MCPRLLSKAFWVKKDFIVKFYWPITNNIGIRIVKTINVPISEAI